MQPPGVAASVLDDEGRHPGDTITENWSSLIGIVTAIVGNVLIALALNVQRYAHIRLHRQRALNRDRARQALKNASKARKSAARTNGGAGYGTVASNGSAETLTNGQAADADGDAHETEPLAASFNSGQSGWSGQTGDSNGDGPGSGPESASNYLKSPYWWAGQVLITVGEMGNFLAYGFAPASIVSPLGVVALISNCVIAPILFKEKFRHRDFWGVIIAIGGAVTVVLSAKQEETKLAPHDVWDAITTMEFEIYLAISCSMIALLMWASPRYGHRTILIDLGLVGLYGAYTVLATKGVSSMLSSTLFGAFTTPVTYALLVILLGTAVMQVRYVNKALQRFDSTQVIPIQFVTFTLSVIVGSAVLYRDFERTTAQQAAKFVGGCLLTFFGVFLITSGRMRDHDDDADESDASLTDDDDFEETMRLAEQAPGTPHTPTHRRGSEAAGSRRSSRASRVSFMDGINRPLAVLAENGVPTMRTPSYPNARDGSEARPLLTNPWANNSPTRPELVIPGPSSDSIPTISSYAIASSQPTTPQAQHNPTPILDAAAPVTPRANPPTAARPHSHHYHHNPNFISPSPLSSTVSAVVADTFLKHMDPAGAGAGPSSPLARRVASRRSRPSLRASLFVPQDELDEEEAAGLLPPFAAGGGGSGLGILTPGRNQHQQAPVTHDGKEAKAGGFRRRARSLSHTISDILSGKRSRKNSASSESDQDGEAAAARRPAAAASTETL